MICATCQTPNPERARFCLECGAPVAPPVSAHESRKTVTLVFCDVAGSTSLGERSDAEAIRAVMSSYFVEMRVAIESHGGVVEKFVGDAVMAAFGLPRVREDDALRAVRAAWEMQQRQRALNERLRGEWGVEIELRIGVNTGEVVAGDVASRETFATGDAVNVAARLEQAARPGEVLLGATTRALVGDAVEVTAVAPLGVKGKSQPLTAYRLLGVRDPHATSVAPLSPLVGRGAELRHLHALLDDAGRTSRPRVVVIIAPAGTGKSRLIAEVGRALPRGAVLEGRCLSYGRGITYWPIGEMIHRLAGIGDDDSSTQARDKLRRYLYGVVEDAEAVGARLEQLVGLRPPVFSQEEGFWAVRQLVEGLARGAPLLLVFEDVHWAEPTLLDLIAFLACETRGGVLIVCLARDEISERHDGWLARVAAASVLRLGPLSEHESAELVEQLMAGVDLVGGLHERVRTAAEGNPLFAEQLVALLAESEDSHSGELTIPPTIHAVLAARLDELGADERVVAQTASVIGRQFARDSVAALAADERSRQLDVLLDELTRRSLIRHVRVALLERDGHEFAHALVRDTAYRSLVKSERRHLHERFADWLEQALGGRAGEYDEIVAYHLEQAHRYDVELRPTAADPVLRERAGSRLGAAGKRAYDRGDLPAAVDFLRRAVEVLPDEDDRRLELMPLLARALSIAGSSDEPARLVAEAEAIATSVGRPRLAMRARLMRASLGTNYGELMPLAEQAVALFESDRDHEGLALAWERLGVGHQMAGRNGHAVIALERALASSREAGAVVLERHIMCQHAIALWAGAVPVGEAADRVRAHLAVTSRDVPERRASKASLSLRADLNTVLATFEAMDERFASARALFEEARRIFSELGQRWELIGYLPLLAGYAELLGDDAGAAEAQLAPSYRELCEVAPLQAATAGGYLAEAVYRQGRLTEALALADAIEETSEAEDVDAAVRWRGVKAKAVARRGDHGRALALAHDAVERAAGTDCIDLQGEALTHLAETLALSGRAGEATDARRRAVERYEHKGNKAGAARVSRLRLDHAP
jgi:class 3 adenylate cyclase/tetratricopeptide (TPR) repeat protein